MNSEDINKMLAKHRDQKFRKRTQGQIDQANIAKANADHQVTDPKWLEKQAEGQQKRKESGWSSKMKGNKNAAGNKNRLGMTNSEESNAKRSEKLMGRKIPSITGVPKPKLTCPHCGKIGGKPQMIQYHFDKCKAKK
jgi:hypothetical protein